MSAKRSRVAFGLLIASALLVVSRVGAQEAHEDGGAAGSMQAIDDAGVGDLPQDTAADGDVPEVPGATARVRTAPPTLSLTSQAAVPAQPKRGDPNELARSEKQKEPAKAKVRFIPLTHDLGLRFLTAGALLRGSLLFGTGESARPMTSVGAFVGLGQSLKVAVLGTFGPWVEERWGWKQPGTVPFPTRVQETTTLRSVGAELTFGLLRWKYLSFGARWFAGKVWIDGPVRMRRSSGEPQNGITQEASGVLTIVLTNYIGADLAAGYRWVPSVDGLQVDDGVLNGPTMSLSLMFGRMR